MGVGVTRQKKSLEEDDAGVPDHWRAAENRQHHLRDHGLDHEHQERAQEGVVANSGTTSGHDSRSTRDTNDPGYPARGLGSMADRAIESRTAREIPRRCTCSPKRRIEVREQAFERNEVCNSRLHLGSAARLDDAQPFGFRLPAAEPPTSPLPTSGKRRRQRRTEPRVATTLR